MKHYPLIGVMVPRKKDRIRLLKLYQRFCREDLNLRLCSFVPSAVSRREKTVTGILFAEEGCEETVLPLPDAVYNRCYNKTVNTFRSVYKLMGRKCFNTITHLNKWVVYTLLEKSELKKFLPQTFLYDLSILPGLLAEWKLLYLKPVHGHKGKRVHRLELADGGDVLISSHSLAPQYICRKNEDMQRIMERILGTKQYIMQEGIRSSRVGQCFFDLRVLVQKIIDGNWKVSFVACRVAYDDYFNTGIFKDIYDAMSFLPQLLNRETALKLLYKLNGLSIGVAKILDKQLGLFGELSVDFILDEDEQPWIIEVNGKPQKSILEGVENFQCKQLIYRRPLEYAYYLSQLPPEE